MQLMHTSKAAVGSGRAQMRLTHINHVPWDTSGARQSLGNTLYVACFLVSNHWLQGLPNVCEVTMAPSGCWLLPMLCHCAATPVLHSPVLPCLAWAPTATGWNEYVPLLFFDRWTSTG